MRRQVPSIGAASFRRFGPGDVVALLCCSVLDAMLRLDVLEGQLDLVFADPLGTTAELGAALDRDDVIEALGTRD